MTDLQRPWIVPPADEMGPEAHRDDDGTIWLSLYEHFVTRPGVKRSHSRIAQGALHALVAPAASTPFMMFGPDPVAATATFVGAIGSLLGYVYGYDGRRAAAKLTPEANALWCHATTFGSRILEAAKGSADEDATRLAVITLQRDILDALEVASTCEFKIWRMLDFDTPGLLKFSLMPARDLRLNLVGDRLVEALDLDECRVEHLLAAAPGIQSLVNLGHFTSESAVNRRVYQDAVGQPAPPRVIDTAAVDQLTAMYEADAATVAALPR